MDRIETGADQMMTYAQALGIAVEELERQQISDASLDARYLLEYVTNMNTAAYYLHCQEQMLPDDYDVYWQFIQRRAEHIPLQHLTGEQEFMGLTFCVSRDVLIPRQDTEILVELALSSVAGKRVLDVCTGSGCIAISLQKLGNAALCHGVDLSGRALEIARKNALRLQADVLFWQSDLFAEVTERYDVIISNPPYIPPSVIEGLAPEVRDFEPRIALNGGEDGLDFYRRIAQEAGDYLTPDGQIFLEIGYDQGEAVKALLEASGFTRVEIRKDLAGRDRVVHGNHRS